MKISFEDYNIPDVFKFIRESANITQLELAKKDAQISSMG